MTNKQQWSVILAYNPWDAHKAVHLVGKSTLSVAKLRAQEVARQEKARHYLIIRTDDLTLV